MDDVIVIATGPSMSQAVADSLRGRVIVAVSDAFRLVPDAYALVSQDRAWWKANPDAYNFKGRKLSTNRLDDIERFDAFQWNQVISTGTNSGLVACCFAQSLGAKRIEMYGFDMHGSHYFGEHAEPLKNTTPLRFKTMMSQFESWNHDGIDVVNMTPGSSLTCFRSGC